MVIQVLVDTRKIAVGTPDMKCISVGDSLVCGLRRSTFSGRIVYVANDGHRSTRERAMSHRAEVISKSRESVNAAPDHFSKPTSRIARRSHDVRWPSKAVVRKIHALAARNRRVVEMDAAALKFGKELSFILTSQGVAFVPNILGEWQASLETVPPDVWLVRKKMSQ